MSQYPLTPGVSQKTYVKSEPLKPTNPKARNISTKQELEEHSRGSHNQMEISRPSLFSCFPFLLLLETLNFQG
ncbi:hypothetical protein MtrunA17_Chr6g0456111 [Medicago truncatula]|uniref:Uncharacterized protein n=1 Tax=Medicago truncatula TaxID=3880 RepID=G7ZUZ8_MEDTR|nr:hypothetical protein MTR_6g016410 [Medicago truncatula]RHN50316.1 hypothetical protein MtrunA17_Chr6g0456111 [Medicago truncatula]